MELRELRYFLAVAREKSITGAAQSLYITQPSLSRQRQNLEREAGQKLFERGSKEITLTEAGVLLKRRAEEMLALYEKTKAELSAETESICGEIYIGSGESYAIDEIAKVAKGLREEHPGITFHFYSGDTQEVTERLDHGLIDFGVLVEPADASKYVCLRLSQKDTWGVLMRKDSPLAEKQWVEPSDLYGKPLIRSRHAMKAAELSAWFGCDAEQMHVAATYNLLYNASLLVKEGLGYAVGLDKIINTTGESELCFRPLKPSFQSSLLVAWKSGQVFSRAARLFLDALRAQCGKDGQK